MTSIQTFGKIPSIFSFQRSMTLTPGTFFNEIEGQKALTPVLVIRHGLRGTQNVSKDGDVAKQEAKKKKDDEERANLNIEQTEDEREAEKKSLERHVSNIQHTESARLDPRATALVVKFGLRMIDLDSALFACASGERDLARLVRESVVNFVTRAKVSEGLMEVSRRIARNVANGSFLWRNRVVAQSVTVSIQSNGQTLSFDALSIPLTSFNNYSADEIALSEIIAAGLRGDRHATINITARVDFGMKGAIEVFPSQAYIEKKPEGFARPLYKLALDVPPEKNDGTQSEIVMGHAALRDQKISNRLRTIDTWYDMFEVVGKPLPIEPNGASIDLMDFFRKGKSTAFDMFSRLNQIDPSSAEGMFCIGSMIRGGVYSGGAEATKTTAGAKVKIDSGAEKDEVA